MRRQSRFAAPVLAATLLAAPAGAEGFSWSAGAATPSETARLFEAACLATLPDFAGANLLLDSLGFSHHPTMLMRNHAAKNLSAMAMTGKDTDPGGARSCAIIANGFGQKSAEQAVAPIVERRFGDTLRRHENAAAGLDHVVWSSEQSARSLKVIVTETGEAAFLGVTIVPRRAGTQP